MHVNAQMHQRLIQVHLPVANCRRRHFPEWNAPDVHVRDAHGRDVPGDTSPKYFDWLEGKIKQYGVGQINSAWGRGWGKDRDNRWLRIEAAFRSLVEGTAAVHVRLT